MSAAPGPERCFTRSRAVGLAAAWALAEATLFFVVPDVALTLIVATLGTTAALWSCGAAALGASVGGALVWLAGSIDIAAVRHVYEHLPAISAGMIDRVAAEMSGPSWFPAMVLGSISGVPYKLFAAEAGHLGIDPRLFLAASPLARLPRFVAVTLLAAGAVRLARPLGHRRILGGTALAWVLFYAGYWWLTPG